MRASALCLSLLAGCIGPINPPNKGGSNKGKSSTGITRELLQRGNSAVVFGESPVPALRSDSVYATIALGVEHGCVIASTGTFADQVICWTFASNQPSPVTLPDRPIQLAAGAAHTCALTESGDAYCWGSNSNGQLGVDPAKVHDSSMPVLVPRGDTVV